MVLVETRLLSSFTTDTCSSVATDILVSKMCAFHSSRFLSQQIIGKGTYGSVFSAFDSQAQKYVAMKVLNVEQNMDQGVPTSVLREVGCIRRIGDHPNVMTVSEVLYVEDEDNRKNVVLVMDIMQYDLYQYIQEFHFAATMPPSKIKDLFWNIVQGVKHCHECSVMHRDLKPSNILINVDGDCSSGGGNIVSIKVADFGLSRLHHVGHECFTPDSTSLSYRSPEILLGQQDYTPAVDVWALGCILAELSTGKVLFRGTNSKQQIREIGSVLGIPSAAEFSVLIPGSKHQFNSVTDELRNVLVASYFNGISPKTTLAGTQFSVGPDGADLITKMLVYDPARRVTLDEIVSHKYFDVCN
jgi:serine/threonine protein kinase